MAVTFATSDVCACVILSIRKARPLGDIWTWTELLFPPNPPALKLFNILHLWVLQSKTGPMSSIWNGAFAFINDFGH